MAIFFLWGDPKTYQFMWNGEMWMVVIVQMPLYNTFVLKSHCLSQSWMCQIQSGCINCTERNLLFDIKNVKVNLYDTSKLDTTWWRPFSTDGEQKLLKSVIFVDVLNSCGVLQKTIGDCKMFEHCKKMIKYCTAVYLCKFVYLCTLHCVLGFSRVLLTLQQAVKPGFSTLLLE